MGRSAAANGDTKALSQMPKGHYESPLKRFARQNEGNVLSSGDSGSNLGSLNDRQIVKTATNVVPTNKPQRNRSYQYHP